MKAMRASINTDLEKFDEISYLEANPDVRIAVLSGRINAAQHYFNHGRFENRPLSVVGQRNHNIIRFIEKHTLGLEIGPSYSPVAPKSLGYNVKILDHTDRLTLVSKYSALGEKTRLIEDVDYIWNGQPYRALVGPSIRFNWVIASHVIEHTPDLISFLLDIADVLEPQGSLVLAVPDKRHCFDRMRPTSSLGRVIDAHFSKQTFHSLGTCYEYFLNYCKLDGKHVWSSTNEVNRINLLPSYSLSQIKSLAERCSAGIEYIDMHSWTFTPSSFTNLIGDLNYLGLQPLVIESISETIDYEFFVCLKRGSVGPSYRNTRHDESNGMTA
jgi:hypothetical protein